MPADPALPLAEHVCQTTFAALPASAVLATRRDMLDTLGAALGGSVAPGVAALARVVKHWGGREESSLWLLGGRVPAPQAALVNATMGHALDFDDTFDRASSIHPGISTLAASLAVAEWCGGLSGRDVVLAVTLGLDVACRVAVVTTDPLTYQDQFGTGPTKRRPTQVVEARFSHPFLVAAGLTLGKIGIGEVAAVDDPRVLALAARIQGAVRDHTPEGWAQITVRRTDGRTASLETTSPSGSPARPLSEAQLHAKFRDCAAHAVRPIPEEVVERAIQLVYHLDEVADAVELVRLFT